MRTLYIDGVPRGTRFTNVVVLVTRADIEDLYQRYFKLKSPPPLTLDCRGLKPYAFNQILKIIEEYRAEITMIAYDPVLPTILSRFMHVVKTFTPKPGSVIALRLKHLSPAIKPKVFNLFGIVTADDERE